MIAASKKVGKKGGASSASPTSVARRPLYHPPNPSPPSCEFCDAVGGLGGMPPVTVLDIRKDGSFVVDVSAFSASTAFSSASTLRKSAATVPQKQLASAVKLFHKRSMYKLLFKVAKVPDVDGRLWSVHGFHAPSFNGKPSRVIVHLFPAATGDEEEDGGKDAPKAKMLAFVSAQHGQHGGFMTTHSLDPEFSSAPRANAKKPETKQSTFSLLHGLKHVVPQPERLLLFDGKNDVLLSVPLRHDLLLSAAAHT